MFVDGKDGALLIRTGLQAGGSASWAETVFLSDPRLVTETSTTSPGLRNTGGLKELPIPANDSFQKIVIGRNRCSGKDLPGVPVAITSPG